MKSHLFRILAIGALGLAIVGGNATPMVAQNGGPVVAGSFRLPNEVKWQGATLPAGDYTFSMKSAAAPAQIQIQGPRGIFVVALTTSKDDSNGQSMLTIDHCGASSVVRELYLAPIGVRLHYYVPKAPKDQELAEGSITHEQVMVAAK